jgi:dTDP-4-amino-4,6-dideoxygalactose transaminase
MSDADDFLVFGSPLIDDAAIAEVVDSLRSGWIGTGPKVQRFERMLETYLGVPHVRCLSSCTAALMLALHALEIGPGDEVIVPTLTFAATANAVIHVGATPILVDSEPRTGNIDLAAAEAAITSCTRALIPVHFAGRPVDLDRLNDLRDRHGIAIVEDAAHALGAEWRGHRLGTHGNLTALSFYATKNVTTAEGGAIVTESADIAEKIERLSLHGLSAGAWQRYSDAGFKHYEVVEPGYKFNLTDLHAALGLHQLPHLDAWIDERAALWARYDELLAELPVELPAAATDELRHARHLYQVLVRPEALLSRDELLEEMTARGIGVGVHYRAIHLHEYYRDRYGFAPEDFPVATDISERTLSLPLSPKVTHADQDRVVRALAGALAVRSGVGVSGGLEGA